jgi:hypothetical protein
MLKLIFLFLLSFNCLADDWTREDSYREAVFLTLHAIDWNQTLQIADHPDLYYEKTSSRFMGSHPSENQVNQYMVGAALLQITVAYLLPAEYRKAFQYITIGEKIPNVMGNFSLGLRVKF